MFSLKRKRKAQSPTQSKPRGLCVCTLYAAAKYAVDAVCILLSLVALAQITLIAVLELGMEIPIPAGTLRHFSGAVAPYGLKVSCDRAYFDFTGGFRIRNLRVTDLQGNNLFIAAQIYAHIPTERLQAGSPDLDTLLVDDASVILPAYLSETGTDLQVVDDISASATICGRTVSVDALQGKVAAMPVAIISGFEFRTGQGNASGTGKVAQKSVPQIVLPGLRRLANACSALNDINGPILFIEPAKDLSDFFVTGLAQGVKRNDWKLTDVSTSFSIGRDRVLRNARLYAASFEYRDAEASIVQIKSCGPIILPENLDSFKNLSVDAEAFVSEIRFKSEIIGGVSISASRMPGVITAHAACQLDGYLECFTVTKPDGGSADVEYDLTANLGTCIRIGKLPKERITSRLSAQSPFRVEGSASIPPDFKGWKADFTVQARDLIVRGYPIDDIRAKGSARQGFVKFGTVSAHSGLSWAEGTYSQDFKTFDWRLDIRGAVYPPELEPLLGHWWRSIWPDFTFDGPRVHADLSISGNWKIHHDTIVKGSVDLEHILYNGVRINKGSLYLSVGDGFVDIYNLVAKADCGTVGGRLSWLLGDGDAMTVVANMTSDVPAGDLDMAFGSVLSDILPDWDFNKPPEITLRGNFEKLSPGVWKDSIYVEGSSDRGSWKKIPFENIAAKVWYSNGKTVISIDDCRLLGGGLTGTIESARANGKPFVKMDIALDETDFTPTVKALQSLSSKKHEADTQGKAGKVNLAFSGSAAPDDFVNTLDGSGHFLIHDAELGKIKVFGALSTLLDGIGISSGTFTLNAIKSNFSIYHALVRFRHTELNGPAIRIETKGNMAIKGGDLDFDAKVFLLSGSQSSLVNAIGAIITPVGYISELTLKGTMEDPTWRFKLDPRNLFGGNGEQKPAQPPSSGTTSGAK
jgi:hypothetical protein